MDNILLADTNARKAKRRSRRFIEKHDKNIIEEDRALARSFSDLSYKTSPYVTYKIYEPKERLIYRLPYYPDRIAHHAIMNVVKEHWTKQFITNTYSCRKRIRHSNNLAGILPSYFGWFQHCNAVNLKRTILDEVRKIENK